MKQFYQYLLVLVLVSSLASSACGNNKKDSPPTPTISLSPQEITHRSAEVMLAVQSLHFLITQSGAMAYLDDDGLLGFRSAEGDFAKPNQVRTKIRIIAAITPIDLAFIAMGNEQYVTDPISGVWQQIPPEWGFNPAVIFDPQIGILVLLQEGLENLALVGIDKINGQPHYRLSGQVDQRRISEMTSGLIGRGQVNVEFWIDMEVFYLRQAHMVEPETDPQTPTTWEFSFTGFDEPVEITAPPNAAPVDG